MVKNFGGKKTKGMARKNLTAKPSNLLRTSANELEKYAQVSKTLGNGMCHVLCHDNITRLCHIRGKFRGRGKRDNFISVGVWLLIGLREWEGSGDGKKMNNCDLLEVYNDQDKERLKNTINDVNWRLFATDRLTNKIIDEDEDVQFMDENEEDYYNLMNEEAKKQKATSQIAFEEEDEICVDDI